MSYRIVEVKPRRYKDYLPSETLPGILKARRYEKIFVVQNWSMSLLVCSGGRKLSASGSMLTGTSASSARKTSSMT